MSLKAIVFLALALATQGAEVEDYTLGEYDSVEEISRSCHMRSMWQVRGTGRKFVNPYESGPGTIVRIVKECAKCLLTPIASPPAGWGVYRTIFDGSETLSELADNLMGDADLASEFVTDVTSGAKPTDLKCEQLFYPMNKVLTNEDQVFQAYEIDSTTTLGRMALHVFDDSSSWGDFYADEEGNAIVDASADTVLQEGQEIFVKLYGGDVVMSEKVQKLDQASDEEDTLFETLQTAVDRDARRWPARGTINYGIASSVTSTETTNARNAIRDIQRDTCLRFRSAPSALAPGKIRFQRRPTPGCSANVGLSRSGNYVNAGGSCGRGTMIHEVGHSIGIRHEHSRSDRDRHITIRWSNIPSSTSPNFNKRRTQDSLTPYDYRSIMHYGARNRMVARPSSTTNTNAMGQRRAMSRFDIIGYNTILGYAGGCSRSRSSMADGAEEEPKALQCGNKYSKCKDWARAGYCVAGSNTAFMERACCRSCERETGKPVIGAMETVCDVSSYPDLKKDCGCFALVENMDSKYGGTCKNYCASFNKTCIAARDDIEDDCDATMTEMACDESLSYANDDALCQCGEKYLSPETPTEPSSAPVIVPALSLLFVLFVSL